MKKLLILATLACCLLTTAQAQRKTDTFNTPNGKTVKITCIKHASIQIEYDGKQIHVDPVGWLTPNTDYTLFPRADYILVTHEHRDHFDREAIAQLSSKNTVLYMNPNCCALAARGFEMQNGDSLGISDDIQLKAVPAYNTTPGREQLHPKGRDNGYILTLGGLRIYIAGDTEDIPEMATLGAIDIAFLPCNQPYTMTPQQLVKAANMVKPRVLFPYHYSDTPIGQVQFLLDGSGIDVRIRDYK